VGVDGTVEEQLTYCRRNLLRVNARHGTNPVNRDDRPEKGVTSEVREAEAFPPGTVVFRDGWHPLEQFFGEQYRWAQRVATITLQPPADGCRNLVLELGAPPGADRKQVRLQVFDGTDSLLGELDLTGRCLLNLSLSDAVKSSRVRFLVRGFSPPAAGDTRDLCFRLFWYEWTVPETEQMTSVGARPLNLRWRLSSAIRRSRRIWRRLVRPTSPVRFGVPFSAPLARRLGLRLDADGLSVNLGGAQPAVITTPEDVSAPEPAVVHTNACGDFTLLSREKWRSLRGYPEFDAYSFNIDSIFCYAAHYAGVREEVLEEPIRIYHIEHGLGSGWTPEGQAQLFERLAAKGIPYVDWKEVTGWAAQMRRLNCPMIFNRENWGLSEYELQETVFPEDR